MEPRRPCCSSAARSPAQLLAFVGRASARRLAARGWSTETIKLATGHGRPGPSARRRGRRRGRRAGLSAVRVRPAGAGRAGSRAPGRGAPRPEGAAPTVTGWRRAARRAPTPTRTKAGRATSVGGHRQLRVPRARPQRPLAEMCRLFAAQGRWHWAGGLSLGGGGVIDGKPLRERGPLTRSVRRRSSSPRRRWTPAATFPPKPRRSWRSR